jgi:hypothetical protein
VPARTRRRTRTRSRVRNILRCSVLMTPHGSPAGDPWRILADLRPESDKKLASCGLKTAAALDEEKHLQASDGAHEAAEQADVIYKSKIGPRSLVSEAAVLTRPLDVWQRRS